MEDKSTESPVVMFTNYKRPDGFEVSFTLRSGATDEDVRNVVARMNDAIEGIKAKGGTPVSRQKQNGFTPKPKDYVEGRVCPVDGGRLVNAETKQGKKFIKCENNKWDFAQKKAVGCEYTDWGSNGEKRADEKRSEYPASTDDTML